MVRSWGGGADEKSLGSINQSGMDFLSIFLEDCQILNFQGVVFIPNTEKLLLWVLK